MPPTITLITFALSWEEPGPPIATPPISGWQYEIRAKGFDPDVLVRVAESLRPYP
jgi:hypothetical protein